MDNNWDNASIDILIDLIKSDTPFEELPLYLNKDENSIKEKIKSSYNQLSKSCKKSITNLKLYIGDNTTNLTNIIPKITGKRVLILDFETTGLLSDQKSFYKYNDHNLYKDCRVIEVGFYYTPNFDNEMDNVLIYNYLRKPTDFTQISPNAEAVHGISFEKIMNEGIEFKLILDSHLLYILNNIDIFISHNTSFDFYVLLNELARLNHWKTIKNLLAIKNANNVICTCRASGYKKLNKLYNDLFNENPEVGHRAGDDVKTLLQILLQRKIKNCAFITG